MNIQEKINHRQPVARLPGKDNSFRGGGGEREISAGIMVFRRTREGLKYLILYHGHEYWNFPKGKIESEERSFAAALRETYEETGLTRRDLRVVQNFRTHERFSFRRKGRRVFKIVIFYIAETRNPRIRISKEHQGYAWFTFKDGMRMLRKYSDSQKMLESANRFLVSSKHSASAAPRAANSQFRSRASDQ